MLLTAPEKRTAREARERGFSIRLTNRHHHHHKLYAAALCSPASSPNMKKGAEAPPPPTPAPHYRKTITHDRAE